MSNYVLVVDDNGSDQKIAKLLVENEGFVAVLASDVPSALEKISDYEFKLFVVDIQMPEVSGLELLKKLKQMDSVKNIPVLIMSGRNTADDVKKAIALGAIDYIIKPIDRSIFSEKLAIHLKNRKSDWYEYPVIDPYKSAFIHESCEVLTINEIGTTLKYHSPMKPGEGRSVGGKIFDEIGIGTSLGRCHECHMLEDGTYLVKISFIGLKEEERTKLRKYCRQVYAKAKNNG